MSTKSIELTEAMLVYALHYGSGCRDCADAQTHGICDSGQPCDPRARVASFIHFCEAINYGIKNNFIVDDRKLPDHLKPNNFNSRKIL